MGQIYINKAVNNYLNSWRAISNDKKQERNDKIQLANDKMQKST